MQISSNQQTVDLETTFDEQALAWFAQGEQPSALELPELNEEPGASSSRTGRWAAASVMLALLMIVLLVV